MTKTILSIIVASALLLGVGYTSSQLADAALVTDPNDPRNWQGATVGTFAELFYGSDDSTTRQQVIDDQLLDDGIFDPTGFTAATLEPTPWALGTGGSPNHNAGDGRGQSLDSTGTGSFAYNITPGTTVFTAGNTIDDTWFQSSDTIGDTVFDLGVPSSKAAIFNTIDHGPLPQEAIESTVYLSNDKVTWTQAVVERVWLEGFESNLGIKWDGFVFAVGTGTGDTFRYASTTWGGPGALISDGDDEINGVLGLNDDFEPPVLNTAPVAEVDEYTIGEDATLNDNATTNDSDAEDDPLTATLVDDVTQGTLVFNSDGTFEYIPTENYFGTDSFTYFVNDGSENSNTATVIITIDAVNDAPICSEGSDLGTLWPPNHKMKSIDISLEATDVDEDELNFTILSVFQDEPVDAKGDGKTKPDAEIVDENTVEVRAERSGNENGRVYHITAEVSDGELSCTGTFTVGVPHDKKDTPVDDGANFDSTES